MPQLPLLRDVDAHLLHWIGCLLLIQRELASPTTAFAVAHPQPPTFRFSWQGSVGFPRRR